MDLLQIDVLESLAHYVHIVSHKYGASKHETETMIRAAEMILGFYQRDEEDGDKEENIPVFEDGRVLTKDVKSKSC